MQKKNTAFYTSILFTLFCMSVHASKTKSKPTTTDLIASSQPSDWRTPSPENLLYLELTSGRVIIELNPDYAPESVSNVKALANEKYWDGLAVIRVQDNYVVQWADPHAEKPDLKRKLKTAKEKIPAELDVTLNKKIPFTVYKDQDVYAKGEISPP